MGGMPELIAGGNMWTVVRIDEADYGCEERMPGEPLMVLVKIKSDDGRECRFECAEDWMEHYYEAVQELEG